MMTNLQIVKIDYKYCDYLRKYDYRVPYNRDKKELRPFIGVLLSINSIEYFAPLSSPKPKHLSMTNTTDFLKIDSGILGAVNFNNMIPVNPQNYEIINLNKSKKNFKDLQYQELLREQLKWLNKYQKEVKNKALKLYNLYKNNRLYKNIKDRCCNFELLEEKCNLYKNKIKVSV